MTGAALPARAAWWLAASLALTAVACGGGGAEEPRSSTTAASQTPAPTMLEGVITEVLPPDAGDVTGFALDADGTDYDILIDPEHDYGFDLGHLRDHRDTGDPVVCQLDPRPDGLYALTIEDA